MRNQHETWLIATEYVTATNSSNQDPSAPRIGRVLLFLAASLLCATQGPSAHGQCVATETVRLAPDDLVAGDLFGRAVALDGDVALVGMSGDGGGPWSSGSARVYRFDGLAWSAEAELISSEPKKNDQFGISVALDGDLAIVGAYEADPSGLQGAGAAFVFRYDGTTWNLEAQLVAPPNEAEAYDWFGRSVAVEGDLVVVGAFGEDDFGSASGAAHVFRRSGGAWSHEAKLTASNGAPGDNFGLSIDLSAGRVIVGAWSHDGTDYDVGAAYIFEDAGSGWQQSAMLTASDGTADDEFGLSVALDGSTALVGAYNDDDSALFAGSAYVFRFDGAVWSEEAKLTPSAPVVAEFFGFSVSLDSGTALIGANQFISGPGRAYVFRWENGSWHERARLVASDAEGGDAFGWSVALSGNTGLVGAFSTGMNLGTAYFYSGVADDCNGNGALDLCDLADGTSSDCDGNGIPDECDINSDPSSDANNNGTLDSCECLVNAYCKSEPNSTGTPALLSHSGSVSVMHNDLTLQASGCPSHEKGVFFYGGAPTALPFGDGTLCITAGSAAYFRFSPVLTDTDGLAQQSIDLASPPQLSGTITHDSTWFFQFWYTDTGSTGGFNLSDALEIRFCQ